MISSFAVLAFGILALPVEPGSWTEQVRIPEGASREDGVRFELKAGVLSVGPWRAGTSGARFEYAKRLPLVRGMVRGKYRTENLYPRQAGVRVQFMKAEKALSSRTFALAPAIEWRSFEVPISRAPAAADSVSIAAGLSEKSDGRVHFRDIEVDDRLQEPPFPEKSGPLTRSAPSKALKPGRYVRVEKHGDAWWLVNPEGRAFFSLASLTPSAEAGELPSMYQAIRGLHFDSLAGSHGLARWAAFNEQLVSKGERPLLQFRTFEVRVGDEYDTVVDASGANPGSPQAQAAARGGFNHAFPDPYDPRWEQAMRKQVREAVALVKEKPYFAGWFAGNEREHRDLHRFVWAPNSAKAFRAFLQRKYRSIAALNKSWKTSYASFHDLMERKPDPVLRAGAMYEDFRLFSRELLKRYNELFLRIIREEDPGRMVLSNRFMIGEQRDVFDNLDLYKNFDVIAVNIYPSNIQPGLAEDEKAFYEMVHRRTGRPVLVGEWSVPAMDSGLYDNVERLDWSYPQTVATQQQRARQAARILTDFYNMPFVVGAHWFTWKDYDSPVRQANRGLFKANGEPWQELQDALRAVHEEVVKRQK